MKSSIIDKIRKLLAVTEARGATPDEAANAAAKVQDLLFTYNLSLGDIKDESEDEIKLSVHEVVGPHISRTGRHVLMHILTKHNFCEAIADTKYHQHILIGKSHNVEVCVYMYQSIGAAIQRMARLAAKENGGDHYVAYFHAFWSGACHTIDERLEAQQAHNRASSVGNALVVQSAGELEAAKQRLLGEGATKPCAHRTKDRAGFMDGREAGKRVPLSAGVSTTNKRGYLS